MCIVSLYKLFESSTFFKDDKQQLQKYRFLETNVWFSLHLQPINIYLGIIT